jgi:hypothetical protein
MQFTFSQITCSQTLCLMPESHNVAKSMFVCVLKTAESKGTFVLSRELELVT